MAQIQKGRLVKGPYKPICRDCAIYFSVIVNPNMEACFLTGECLEISHGILRIIDQKSNG